MKPLEVIHEDPSATDMPSESGTRQGCVSLARVVKALGTLNGQSRMSSKKSAAAGGALREIYGGGLTPAAAASIANHMRLASREDPLMLMHHLQANLEAALPELVPSVPIGARPTKAGGASPTPKKRARPKKAAAKGGGAGRDSGYGGDRCLGGRSLSLNRALAV